MKPYRLQTLYRQLNSPALRLGAIRAARGLGMRYLVLRVDTNDICNLRCPMCYMSDPNRVPVATPMSTESFTRVAEQLFHRTRFLYLSCGTEPLATPHFDDLLDIVGRYKVPFTSYCTNGILLRDRFIDATLRNRLSEVIVSVDGATKEVYEKIRVGGRWETLNERLAALAARIAAHEGPVPEMRLNFTAQVDNVFQMEDFARWTLQWQPAMLQYRIFRPLAGAQKQTDDHRTMLEFHRRLPAVRALCAQHGIAVESSEVPAAGVVESSAAPEPPPSRSINCQLPWFTMYVKPNGEVQPCPVHPPIGNIFASTYREIDRGPEMADLRHSLRRCPKELCIDCQRAGASGI